MVLLIFCSQRQQINSTFSYFWRFDGYLEFSFRLDGEESFLRTNTRVDDGNRHVTVITRNANRAALELDNLTVHGETRSVDRDVSHLPGNLFIGKFNVSFFNCSNRQFQIKNVVILCAGGAPDINTFTGSRYTSGFNGCINIIEGTDTRAINLRQNAISGYNVVPCSE